MARHSRDGKSGGGAAADAAGKGSGKGERGAAAPAGGAETPSKSWAQRNAGTFYILGAFGIVVLIAVLRASCN